MKASSLIVPPPEVTADPPPVGPELDLFIAQYVLGDVRLRQDDPIALKRHAVMFLRQQRVIRGEPYALDEVEGRQIYSHSFTVWSPSTNDRDALAVLDAIGEQMRETTSVTLRRGPDSAILASEARVTNGDGELVAEGATRAEAICRLGHLVVRLGCLGAIEQLRRRTMLETAAP